MARSTKQTAKPSATRKTTAKAAVATSPEIEATHDPQTLSLAFDEAISPEVISDENQSRSAALVLSEESADGLADDFLTLWLPYELEIGRLGRSVMWDSEAERQGQLEERRAVLERLFVEVEQGSEAAKHAYAALEEVMAAFSARVEMLLRSRPFSPQDSTPGEVAMRQLSGEAPFLQLATAYGAAMVAWLFRSFENDEREASRRSPGRRAKPLAALLRFSNDAPHQVAVRGLSQVEAWQPSDDFAYAFNHNMAGARVTMGLPEGAGVEGIWEYLAKGGPRMVKAHYALWARFYEEYDNNAMPQIFVSIPQFCADLGYTPHKNGGYRPEHKREAFKIFEALTSLQVVVSKTFGKQERRIRGPLWARGFEAQEREVYSNFGAPEGESKGQWDLTAFSYTPGPWFHDAQWRKHHQHIGKIGSGLLKLSPNTDQWPILIGGYLGTLARNSGFGVARIRVGTLLKNLNLAQSADQMRRVAQNREKLERALDRLADEEVGIIASWRFENSPEISEPNMDDIESLSQYGAQEVYPTGDWRAWMIEVSFPFQEDQKRLREKRAKALSARAKKPLRKAAD